MKRQSDHPFVKSHGLPNVWYFHRKAERELEKRASMGRERKL